MSSLTFKGSIKKIRPNTVGCMHVPTDIHWRWGQPCYLTTRWRYTWFTWVRWLDMNIIYIVFSWHSHSIYFDLLPVMLRQSESCVRCAIQPDAETLLWSCSCFSGDLARLLILTCVEGLSSCPRLDLCPVCLLLPSVENLFIPWCRKPALCLCN